MRALLQRVSEASGERVDVAISPYPSYSDAAVRYHIRLLSRTASRDTCDRGGNRPSWGDAASGEVAEPPTGRTFAALNAQRGGFGADIAVALVNDGPVTLLLESR